MAEHELNKIVDDDGEVFNLRDSTKQPVADRVTSWGSTPSDTKYPSEKLVKDSLDAKVSAREEQVATVQDLIQSVRVKPGGSVGSALLTSASTVSGFSIPNAWYNYIWVPHRNGASNDSQKYGTLILTPLTNAPDVYVIEGANLTTSSPIYRAVKLASNVDARTISQDVSKGANLVVNGSGRMSSNYNFSNFLYVPTIASGGSAGSFGFNGVLKCDEYISCDFNKKIVFSVDVKNLATQPNNCVHRIFVHEYDIDKKSIAAINVMFGVGTLTELTQDLNPGDTVVHLADLSNANWLSTTTYHHGFIFWNYTNSYGYLYPPETYSRNVYPSSSDSVSLWEVENVNVSAGTITLNNPWAGPAIPAGTKVSRRQSANTYLYPASATISDTEWHTLKGYLRGITAPGTSERGSKFSQGTAFIRVGLYPTSLTNADETIGKRAVFANLAMYEEQDFADGYGVLPVANGGTGKTSVTAGNYLVGNGTNALIEKTPNAAANNMLSALPDWSENPTDGVKLIRRDTGGSASFGQVTFLTVWNYIKDKISSVLGLSTTGYTGNAATATAFSSGTAKTKFDGIADGATKVESSTTNGNIKINGTETTVYTHPTNGANTSKGDTTDQTPSFGHTFKALSATVDSQGHTTSLSEHTVKIPDTVVTGGNSGEAGLMSPTDKDKVDALGTASTKDVPTSGNASSSQVVMGNDSRLTDSRTPNSHTHGNIQNGGTLQTNDVAIANGDKLVITDARDSDKVARSSVTFDGSTTSKALTPKGTFETFLQSHQDISGKVSKTGDTMTGALTISNNSGTGVEVVHGNSNINTELRATRSDTGVSMWTGIGSGGERHGLYSYPAASGPNGDGWVTVTEANGLSSFKGKCDGYYGVYFGASSTLRAKKRLLLGYTNEQASQYERVHASAIIDVRMQSGSGSPGITMLLTISARGTSYFITRLHVLSHSGWDPSNFCPVLVNFNNNNKTAICLALATSKSSTTLKEFGYTDVKVLPINDCTGFSWEFAYDDVSFDSSYMFMFKPYSYPSSVIGTAVGDSNTPVSIDSSGNFSTVDTVKNSLKWNGYDLVIGQAPTTPADNTIYIF